MTNVISLSAHLQKRAIAELDELQLPPKGTQLTLQFFIPHNLVLIFADDFSDRHSFEAFTEHANPYLIVDLRIAPRLNFIAITRSVALSSLKQKNICYLDIRGKLEQNMPKTLSSFESLSGEIKNFLISLEVSQHPILMLFDDMGLLRRINLSLNEEQNVVVAGKHYIDSVAANAERLRM